MKFYVYLLKDSSGLFKIGYTGNLDRRMAHYRTHNPRVELAHTTSIPNEYGAQQVERFSHLVLGARRVDGEWFECSEQEAHNALQAALEAMTVLAMAQKKIANPSNVVAIDGGVA